MDLNARGRAAGHGLSPRTRALIQAWGGIIGSVSWVTWCLGLASGLSGVSEGGAARGSEDWDATRAGAVNGFSVLGPRR